MAEHDDATEQYGKIKSVPVPDISGYPNKVANTQTQKIRGTGAATKGTGYSKNSN